MGDNRLETLKSLVAQNPNDCFARYGLAMEHARSGHLELAVEQYRRLLAINPKYIAAYYHSGQALEKLSRLEEAREIYRRGIEVATAAGDLHTRDEIQTALDLLG